MAMEGSTPATHAGSELILYHAWPSSASRKVRFCLEEKRLAYDGIVVDLFKLEQHSEQYRTLNPNGMVPTLVHRGRAVIESTVINEYIDSVFPEPGLRPGDPYYRAQMRIWTKHADEVVIRAFQVASWNSVMGPVASQWSDTELQVKLQSIPTPARREDWYRMARRPFTEAEIQFSVSQIRRTVEMMELALEHAPWLAGEAFSLADINMSPYAVRFVEHRPNGILLDDFPKVADWWRRVQERPAFGRARIESTVKASQEAANAAQITT